MKLLQKVIAKFVVYILRHKRLSGEAKAICTSALLDNLFAIPICDIITFDTQGTIQIRGRTLEPEQAKVFAESARLLRDSFAKKVIREQVAYEAVKLGVKQGLTPDMILFAKAALWYDQEERNLLDKILPE